MRCYCALYSADVGITRERNIKIYNTNDQMITSMPETKQSFKTKMTFQRFRICRAHRCSLKSLSPLMQGFEERRKIVLAPRDQNLVELVGFTR